MYVVCIVKIRREKISFNRNGAVNNASLNAGQVAMTIDPTGYAMFSDPFFFYNICPERLQSTQAFP